MLLEKEQSQFCNKLTKNDDCHAENLNATADNSSKKFRMLWWTEHIAVNEFPSGFFHRLVIGVILIVPKN